MLFRSYRTVVQRLLRHPRRVVAGTLAVLLVAVMAYRTLPTEFAPADDRGMAWISVTAPEGASLGYTDDYARRIEAIVEEESAAHGDIKRYIVRLPGGFGGGTGEVNSARIMVILQDFGYPGRRPLKEVLASLSARLDRLPGVRTFVEIGRAHV